ncbi:hypothetical protein L9F63_013811 [Diploptera punctata]|uniref:Cytochrome P450 n=1 Tax=Diploptera punctata TaxID=6984 RepID=A0AAD8AA39_DIPPU|nr:hypothetical protein L9F63_013811 [Diploptera punctata]
MSWISILFVVIILFLLTLYLYFSKNVNYWKIRNIPYVEPFPFLGNLKDVLLQKVDIGHHLKNIHDKFKGTPYVGIFFFDQPALLIRDLDLVKNILVKDSYEYFMDRIMNMDEKVDPMGGKNMFSLKGEKWRFMRSKMTPTFTSVKMKNMLHLVQHCGEELVTCIDRLSTEAGGSVHVKDLTARYTTDVIASCAFGIESNSLRDPEAEFRRILRSIFQFSPRKALAGFTSFFAPKLQRIFKLRLINEEVTNFVRNTLWRTMEYREKNGTTRKDFIDSIMQIVRKNGIQESGFTYIESQGHKLKIDGDDFVAQAYIFLAAGFEPASTTMSFALYELSFRPDIQNQMREEITTVLNKFNNDIDYNALQEMTYLDMVVSETLRKYPVVPFVDRVASKDYIITSSDEKNLLLAAGTSVYISVLGIHNDPEYYTEPNVFDPLRFTEENKNQRPHYAYLPFGEGPRTCIGARFGLMGVKIGLIHILLNYEVSPCENTPTSLTFDTKPFLLATEGEIPLHFKRIRK